MTSGWATLGETEGPNFWLGSPVNVKLLCILSFSLFFFLPSLLVKETVFLVKQNLLQNVVLIFKWSHPTETLSGWKKGRFQMVVLQLNKSVSFSSGSRITANTDTSCFPAQPWNNFLSLRRAGNTSKVQWQSQIDLCLCDLYFYPPSPGADETVT